MMEWKYSKLKNLKIEDFVSSHKLPTKPHHEDFKMLAERSTGETYNLVLINGELDQTLSTLDVLPKGLTIQKSLKAIPDHVSDRFNAQLGEGVVYEINLAAETSLNRPLKILSYQSNGQNGESLLVQPQILVTIGTRSKMQLLVESVGSKNHKYFLNGRMHFEVGDSAHFEFVQLGEESSESFQLWRYTYNVQKNASLRSLFTSLETGIGRTEVYIPVAGENIHNEFYALGTLRGKSQFDFQTLIDHKVGNSHTTQICKILADDEARASFGGKVLIAKDAQKTTIEQLNQNILLSGKAEIDSEPQLEIDADDVKASHGSTVGGLDPQEIFYLQSRAIPKEKALQILSFGFVNELVQKVEHPVLKNQAEKRLRHYFKQVGEN